MTSRTAPWILGLLAAACGSDAAARTPAPADTPRESGRVSIPPEVTASLDAWVGREATLIGDVIEVEATSVPFAGQVSLESSRDVDEQGRRIVERTETVDAASGVRTITLTNRSSFKTTLDALPRARIGTGLQFIATDRLVLRYVKPPGMDRPVALTAVATGRARFIEGEQAIRAESISLQCDIVQGPRGYEFRSSQEKRP